MMIGTQILINNNQKVPMECFFNSDNFHILSQEEMNNLHTEEEIENTRIVSEMCCDYEISSKPNLPPFDCGQNPDEFLRQLCRNGWKEKITGSISTDNQEDYVNRIKYELDILQGAGLSSYFFIV